MTTEWDPIASWQDVRADRIDGAGPVYEPVLAGCPVLRTEEAFGGFWGVYDHEHLVRAVMDTRTFSSELPFFGVRRPPLESDPPEHTAYRRMLNRYFRPEEMARLETGVRDRAVRMLDGLIARGSADFFAEFTHPFPTRVLCALMRIPDEDWRLINDWALAVDRRGGRLPPGDPERRTLGEEIQPYLRQLIRTRRADLGEDIVSGMIRGEVRGRPLDDDEIASLVLLLVSAGHNTTTSGIGNLVLRLARDAELQDTLRADPARIPDAVEESLRIDSPQQAMKRVARVDTELAGRHIAAGEFVWLAFGAANLDPTHWDRPAAFDLDRTDRRHVAFGRGVHQCVGAPLARLEMRVVIEELLARTESFRVNGAVRRPEWPRMGVVALPLAFDRSEDN